MRSRAAKFTAFFLLALLAYFFLILIDANCNDTLGFCKVYEPLTPW